MSLAPDEKELADAAYMRLRYWRKGWGGWMRVIFAVVFVESAYELVQTLHNPGISHHRAIILAAVLGSSMTSSIFVAFAQGGLIRRDERVVRLFENHFPNECSWKQEESILAEAEEIRVKAASREIPHTKS